MLRPADVRVVNLRQRWLCTDTAFREFPTTMGGKVSDNLPAIVLVK